MDRGWVNNKKNSQQSAVPQMPKPTNWLSELNWTLNMVDSSITLAIQMIFSIIQWSVFGIRLLC